MVFANPVPVGRGDVHQFRGYAFNCQVVPVGIGGTVEQAVVIVRVGAIIGVHG